MKTPKQVIANIRAKGDLTLEALLLAAELTTIFGPEELLRRLRLVEKSRGKLDPQSRTRGIRASPALVKAALTMGLLGKDELGLRLEQLDQVLDHATEVSQAPPELTFGLRLGEWQDPSSGKSFGFTEPSEISGIKGEPQAIAAFDRPRNFATLFIGEPQTGEAAKTFKATMLVRAVPDEATGFLATIDRLQNQVPPSAKNAFRKQVLPPLRDAILPRTDEPFVRRELVLWAPFDYAVKQAQGEITALLEKEPMAPNQIAATIAAAWDGRPTTPLQGDDELEALLWRIAPFNPQPHKKSFTGSGEEFFFFYLEPERSEEAISKLLGLDLDYLLTIELVDGQPKAQLLARGRERTEGRSDYFRRQLESTCQIVRRITGENNVVRANWSFQPGSPQGMDFGVMPLADPLLLINGLASTISPLREQGDIFVGIEAGGPRRLIPLGHPKKGGNMHFLFLGPGGSGKTALMNLLSLQIAGSMVVSFGFSSAGGEAFPGLCYLLAKDKEEIDEPTEEGIHLSCSRANGHKPSREWFFSFIAGQEGIQHNFEEKVVPAVREWVQALSLPADLPLSVRPMPGCNPALYAGGVALAWTGIDPWGQNRFKGLRQKLTEMIMVAESDLRVVVRLDDMGETAKSSDGEEDVRQCAASVHKMAFDTATSGHKDGLQLLLGLQSLEELDAFFPGMKGRFHKAFHVNREDGREGRVYEIFDPNRPDEIQEEVALDLSHYPELARLLTRE